MIKFATYKQVTTDGPISWGRSENKIGPVATLADEYGGRAQIIEDDHCYVLLILKDGIYEDSSWLFPEAVEVIKRLVTPKYAKIQMNVSKTAARIFKRD